ncbi:MAG: hypothetical protein ACKO26_01045 [Planctomycetota bacterium]
MIRFLALFAVSFFLTACGDAKIEVPKDSDALRKQQEQSQNKAADEERAMQKQMQKK